MEETRNTSYGVTPLLVHLILYLIFSPAPMDVRFLGNCTIPLPAAICWVATRLILSLPDSYMQSETPT